MSQFRKYKLYSPPTSSSSNYVVKQEEEEEEIVGDGKVHLKNFIKKNSSSPKKMIAPQNTEEEQLYIQYIRSFQAEKDDMERKFQKLLLETELETSLTLKKRDKFIEELKFELSDALDMLKKESEDKQRVFDSLKETYAVELDREKQKWQKEKKILEEEFLEREEKNRRDYQTKLEQQQQEKNSLMEQNHEEVKGIMVKLLEMQKEKEVLIQTLGLEKQTLSNNQLNFINELKLKNDSEVKSMQEKHSQQLEMLEKEMKKNYEEQLLKQASENSVLKKQLENLQNSQVEKIVTLEKNQKEQIDKMECVFREKETLLGLEFERKLEMEKKANENNLVLMENKFTSEVKEKEKVLGLYLKLKQDGAKISNSAICSSTALLVFQLLVLFILVAFLFGFKMKHRKIIKKKKKNLIKIYLP